MGYYPIFVELKDRRCAVIGGGAVAERKVRQLLECGATVTVIAPELADGFTSLEGDERVAIRRRRYEQGDLAGVFLAIAATDDAEINKMVADEARQRGALVNVADAPELCEFIAPAVIRRGDLVVAISTGGLSPALARWVREDLENHMGPEFQRLAVLLGEARRHLRERGLTVDSERWQQAIDGELRGLLRQDDMEAARELLLKRLTARAVAR